MRESDLDIAVTEGIISRDQAQQLRALSRRLSSMSDAPLDFEQETRDEPFRLLRGFRDLFIAIALAIFFVGISGVAVWLTPNVNIMDAVFQGNAGDYLVALAIAAGLLVVGALLAEWITRLQRLPLASLVLSLVIATWSAAFATLVTANFASDLYANIDAAPAAIMWSNVIGASVGLLIFYWRYRLPFTLLPLAGVAATFIYLIVQAFTGEVWIEENSRIVIGVLGLGVFAVAMAYDMRDRLRVTRFSECAFWLHLMAAPMVVHSLFGGSDAPDGVSPAVILSTMAALCLVAILIDRRPLLVSGILYLAIAIGQLVETIGALADVGTMMTALILGGVLLFLGLGWTPIRRIFLALIPFERLKAVLPPTAPA